MKNSEDILETKELSYSERVKATRDAYYKAVSESGIFIDYILPSDMCPIKYYEKALKSLPEFIARCAAANSLEEESGKEQKEEKLSIIDIIEELKDTLVYHLHKNFAKIFYGKTNM